MTTRTVVLYHVAISDFRQYNLADLIRDRITASGPTWRMDMTEQTELANNSARQLPTARHRRAFGDLEIEWVAPANPDCLLDDETIMQSYEQMRWHPYWAQAWDASMGLCQHLATRDLRGRRVLDLGCGLGITSAVLLAAGAVVVAGDNAPPALEFARANTALWRERCHVQLIDWHVTRLNEKFVLIVGSDILYDRDEIDPLDRFLREHLAPGGEVLLSDPSRAMTDEFLRRLSNLGWKQTQSTIAVDGIKPLIRLTTMTRDP